MTHPTDTDAQSESEDWSTFTSGQTLRLTGSTDDAARLARLNARCVREALAFTLTYSPTRISGERTPRLDNFHIRLGINV